MERAGKVCWGFPGPQVTWKGKSFNRLRFGVYKFVTSLRPWIFKNKPFMFFSTIFWMRTFQLERTFKLYGKCRKLFSQVYTAQSFQVNIGYYTSFYRQFITDPIETIYFCLWRNIKPQNAKRAQCNPIHFILRFAVLAAHVSMSLKFHTQEKTDC